MAINVAFRVLRPEAHRGVHDSQLIETFITRGLRPRMGSVSSSP